MAWQILLLSRGRPLLVQNKLPLRMPFFLAKAFSWAARFFGKITILYFPFIKISAFPLITASTVTYLNSLTLMPVLHIVIMR